MFDDKKYARDIWTADKIEFLEENWMQQKEKWYDLLEDLIPTENIRTLDVGCGVGMFYDLLIEKSESYLGVDPVPAMVERARKRRPSGRFKIGSVYHLQHPSNWFDFVFCWSVLIHLPHHTLERAIRELWRVTKRLLLFNLYVALDGELDFSTKGSWGELLTAMTSFWIGRLLVQLNAKNISTKDYEPVEVLRGRRFQRRIFRLWKK